MIDIDSKFQHSTQLYTYPRPNEEICLNFGGLDPGQRGNVMVSLDSAMTKQQTIILAKTPTSEFVLELRPRRLTEIEKAKLSR